ncbi:hypothetical protein MFRU_026g01070 [Monilinia fructicola]|nr:hypothetical protein MFRU_026g01070 [Monilinia fructicola]
MSQIYSYQDGFGCCTQGVIWETCPYCGGSQRINCTPCNNSRVFGTPCGTHSASANYYSSMNTVPNHGSREVKRSSGKNGRSGGRSVK